MYNLLIALGAGVATTLIFGFALGGGSFSILYGLIPGLLALVITYVILARRTMNQVQQIVTRAQKYIQGQNIDKGVEVLNEAFPLGKWQFFVEAQVHAQIGSVYYMARRFDDAHPHLKKAFKKSWSARAMLGTLHYKRNNYERMEDVFEEAVTANKKKPLLWNLYAYCLWKSGQRDKAIDVLNRAIDKLDSDEKTEKNLDALKNNRKMKMRGWGHQWYQFHLDTHPAQRQQMQFRRR